MISAALRKSMILWTMVGYRKGNSAISWFQPQMLLRAYVNKGGVGAGGEEDIDTPLGDFSTILSARLLSNRGEEDIDTPLGDS